MKNKVIVTVLMFLALVLAGCASPYAPATHILPEHIKDIYIRPFSNNTTQYGLEDKFTLAVVDEFIRDGRWAIINQETEADGMLVAEITKYIKEPLTYDASMVVQQYKLWILVNVYFVDKVNNVTLWEEPNMEGIQIYYDASSPGGRTEEEVVEIIWENMARDIVKRTVEGFGSVTGASEKKVPQ